MNVYSLSTLLGGNPPKDSTYDSLNESRKKRINEFIKNIPKNYSVGTIQEDINKLSAHPEKFVKFINSFQLIGTGFAIFIFLLYWALFGFWVGLLVGFVILIASSVLDTQLGDLFDLSQDSKNLIKDYDDLLSKLDNEQKKQNKNKK